MEFEDLKAKVLAYHKIEVQDGLENFGVPLHLAFIYCMLCFAIYTVAAVFSPFLVRGWEDFKPDTKKGWVNRMAAIVHAFFMSFLAAWYWINENPTIEIPATVGSFERRTTNLMVGYLVYDFFIEIFTNEKIDTFIVLHHVIGLLSHLATLMTNDGFCGIYCMLVFLAEFSTPVLHTLWCLKQQKLEKTPLFFTTAALLLVVFFLCRVVLSPFILYTYWVWKDKYYHGSLINYYLQYAVLIFFGFLNNFWFYQLLRLATKSANGKKANKKLE